MRPLHILLDVDDVVAGLVAAWLAEYNRVFTDRLCVEDVGGWDMTQAVKPECGEAIYGFVTPKLYERVLPLDYARSTVKLLRGQGHRVTFVTSCINGTADAKLSWLVRWGFLEPAKSQPDYVVAHDKALVRGDVLADDRIENVQSFPGHGVLVSRPWNLASPLPRVDSLRGLPAYLAWHQQHSPYKL